MGARAYLRHMILAVYRILRTLREVLATLKRLEKRMAAIDDFISAQQAFNADIAADLTTIATNIGNLNQQITDLQGQLANAGLTPAQLQAIADLQTAGQALETQADTLAGKTPPAPPAAPAAS